MKGKSFKLAVLVALIVFYLVATSAYGEEPKMSIEETTWDFGNIPSDCVVSHEYWLKNVGTDSLKNITVRAG